MSPADPEGLDKHRLHARYDEYRKHRFFAADGLLNQLGALAWKAASQEQGRQKLIASSLATILCDAAARMEGRPITVASGERWFDLMDQPIARCLDILVGKTNEPAEAALIALQRAYGLVTVEISQSGPLPI